MIYDDIRNWLNDISTWFSIPGYKFYTSYSLHKQTFKNDQLLQHFINIAFNQNKNINKDKFIEWFEYEFSHKLPTYLESYLELANNGYLYDESSNSIYTNFNSLGHIYWNIHSSELVLDVFYFTQDDSLKLTWIGTTVDNVYRSERSINYHMSKIDSSCSFIRSTLFTHYMMNETIQGVVDYSSAEKVLNLLKNYRFEYDYLSSLFSNIQSSMAMSWFSSVLNKPVEDILSEVLAFQLDIKIEKVSALVHIIGIEDVKSLIDSLIAQRDYKPELLSELQDFNLA